MPTFDTAKPITATLHVEVGDTRITATDRVDTVVEVRPSAPDNKDDLRAAKETKVEYADGRLTVRTPKARGLFGPKGSVFLEVSVPSGSRLTGIIKVGNLNATGPLDECDVLTSAGDPAGRAGPYGPAEDLVRGRHPRPRHRRRRRQHLLGRRTDPQGRRQRGAQELQRHHLGRGRGRMSCG